MLRRNSIFSLHKKTSQICKHLMSTNPEPILQSDDSFRTAENNPINHTKDHVAKFYRVSSDVKKKLFLHGGFPKAFETHVKTFAENCLMVREPALDVISCLKTIDYSKPAVRFVLYGKQGNGKSLSLAHIMHYAHEAGYLIVHVPWVANWTRRCKESCNSSTKEGFIDLPLDAAAWLIHFKTQNQHLLSNPELKTSQDYIWSKREITPIDSPLSTLVEHGINRVKYSSDCIIALAEEIKKLSTANKCRTLVAIDGFNAFFYQNTRVFTEKKEMVMPENITLTKAFLSLTSYNWCNGTAVVTVDDIAIREEDRVSHLPKCLLGKKGFEHMDPFIPVHVAGYSEKELMSCMDYFRERRWVRTEPREDVELGLLSALNPYRLMQICAPL